MSIFEGYVSESPFDELFDDEKNIKPHWKGIVEKIEELGLDFLEKKQLEIDWHLENNGVTYNTYGDVDGPSNRLWKFDPIPFVIDESEWNEIKKGLEQRAKLFNLILKDLYSDQNLIKENILPSELVFTHKGFLAEIFGFGDKEDFNLNLYAADMARGPDGKMWVVNDKAQAPSGIGYTIENRLTMNVITKDLYTDIQIKKLAPFLESYQELLHTLAGGDISHAALLTSGPHTETYFEHAYLSSYLGIDTVQGQDLLCKNSSLWLKSLSGLKKINTLIRRVDDKDCDPLELDNESQLGVAGLVGAMREDNLNMVNPIGSAIAENYALNPFMAKICEYFLGEELILPQIARWWCGQKEAYKYVIKNLDDLIVQNIDKTKGSKIYFCSKLSLHAKEELKQLIKNNPYEYIAQENISFSTVPYYSDGRIEPRNSVIRTYCLKKDDGYMVMDGGLVRIAKDKEDLLFSMRKGGISKDLWILGDDSSKAISNKLIYKEYAETSIDKISTLKAENLYWLGRYLARAIATTRLISHIIKKITNFYRYEMETSKESQIIMNKALTHMSMTYPGFLDTLNEEHLLTFPMDEIISVIKDTNRSGSLSFTMSMLSGANISLKDILTADSWRLFQRIQKDWINFLNREFDSTIDVAGELDKYMIYLMAYKELVHESIFKEQGLVLYEIGYAIEDALLLISKARSMLTLKLEMSTEYEVLEAMLNSMASFNAYRAHYKTAISLENVIEFIIINKQFPKSLAYIIDKLLVEFELLPRAKEDTPYKESMLKAQALFATIDVKKMTAIEDNEAVYTGLDNILAELSDLFLECSDEFSNTYFAHNDD